MSVYLDKQFKLYSINADNLNDVHMSGESFAVAPFKDCISFFMRERLRESVSAQVGRGAEEERESERESESQADSAVSVEPIAKLELKTLRW